VNRLSVSALWDGMTGALLSDLSRMFFIAAPFTLLLGVALDLFGPPPPVALSEITPGQWFWRLAVPALSASFAQLVVTGLVLRPDADPRLAFAAALPLWPVYLAAQILSALPVGVGLLLLFVPGLYLYARLGFLGSAIIMAEGGRPLAILRRSWDLSEGAQLPLFLFLIVALFAMVGIFMMTGGVGAALDVLARFLGLETVGRFLSSVAAGVASAVIAIAGAAASVVAYRRLAI
jgi:hypothetical protein